MSEERVVERFRKPTIWFHWIHTAAFIILVVTGAILFLPGIGAPAAGGITNIPQERIQDYTNLFGRI